MSLIAPNVLRQQPQYAAQIDWGNPLSAGLVSLLWVHPNGIAYDLLAPSIVYTKTNVSPLGTTQGYGSQVTTAGANGITSGRNLALNCKVASSPMAYMLFGEIGTMGASNTVAGCGGGYQLWSLYGIRSRRASVYAGGSQRSVDVGTWATGIGVFGVVADGGNVIGYENGKSFGSTAGSGAITYDNTYGHAHIFGGGGGDITSCTGTAFYSATWNRALTPSEAKSLSDNPWQIFKAPSRKIFLPSLGGAASYSLSLAAGTYAYAGTAANLNTTRALSLAAGSYAYAGANASVPAGRRLPLASGTYGYTGSTALLKVARSLTLDVGTYAYAGTAATLTYTPGTSAIGRPVSDALAGAWTPSAGGDLYAMVDEVSPSDADFISTASGSTCEMVFNPTTFPGTATQTISYRASSTVGSTLTVTLFQGATTIASWSHALTGTITLYTQTLTAPEIATIVAGAISVRLTSS